MVYSIAHPNLILKYCLCDLATIRNLGKRGKGELETTVIKANPETFPPSYDLFLFRQFRLMNAAARIDRLTSSQQLLLKVFITF